jgi:putative flippase GtrA
VKARTQASRGAAFFAVGALGFALQLSTMALLTMAAGWPYAPAAAVAVELAVIHNFWWHERWTWRDRLTDGDSVWVRLFRFHVSAGLTSIAGSLVFTTLFVEAAGTAPVVANALAVGVTAAVNYALADQWVFARRTAGAAPLALMLLAPTVARAADLKSETEQAWATYVTEAERRVHALPGRAGEEPTGSVVRVPGGTIHHWKGAILIRDVTVDELLHGLMYPGTPPPQADVIESRLLDRRGNSLHVYLRLVRKAIVTATYDTEHQMTFLRQSDRLATSHSVATRIDEVGGSDRGFLWRLNSYWRYRAVPEGVLVEMESLSLSRDVPSVLRPVAGPIINRIARESVTRTLDAMRQHFRT